MEPDEVRAEYDDGVAPDPCKPRPGEPGYTTYEPWEDPAFQWFRDLNREAREAAPPKPVVCRICGQTMTMIAHGVIYRTWRCSACRHVEEWSAND
jgi:hypothetical protein